MEASSDPGRSAGAARSTTVPFTEHSVGWGRFARTIGKPCRNDAPGLDDPVSPAGASVSPCTMVGYPNQSIAKAARRVRRRTGAAAGRQRLRTIDLFCGAGGLTRGFVDTGHFEPVWANDINEYAARTYNENFGDHCVAGDIVSILADPTFVVPTADVVIGGPPCQGFSLLNKNRDGDPRKQLWRPYLEVIERSGARAFVMENVPQLLASDEYVEIQAEARRLGFELKPMKLCAADYGVPQTRTRAVILGLRGMDPAAYFPPIKTHYNPDKVAPNADGYVARAKKWVTVRDVIADLPNPVGTEVRDVPPPLDLHFGRSPTPLSKERYEAVPEGGNRVDLLQNRPDITPECWKWKKGGTDLFGRLWWNRPSVTIRTEFYKPEKGRYLHPVRHRPITHREAARFQSFPDDFVFTGTKIEIAKQIGNAVPPLLGRRVAECVVAALATAVV